jgi:hypothetical protein
MSCHATSLTNSGVRASAMRWPVLSRPSIPLFPAPLAFPIYLRLTLRSSSSSKCRQHQQVMSSPSALIRTACWSACCCKGSRAVVLVLPPVSQRTPVCADRPRRRVGTKQLLLLLLVAPAKCPSTCQGRKWAGQFPRQLLSRQKGWQQQMVSNTCQTVAPDNHEQLGTCTDGLLRLCLHHCTVCVRAPDHAI